MQPTLTLTLLDGPAVHVTLTDPAQRQLLALVAGQAAAARATAEVLTRTYHLGAEATPGRGYDDRLSARTGCGATKLRAALNTPARRGGLRHQLNGTRYVVTETAVREWQGDAPATA